MQPTTAEVVMATRIGAADTHMTEDGHPERWRAFAVISIAVFISILDLFIVNIAFPDIQRDFSSAGLSELSWVLSAYAIVLAALLVPFGKLGDLAGRRRVFELGLLTFIAGSALAAAAPSLELLIAARALQGVAGAALAVATIGILTLGLVQGPQWHWDERAVTCFVLAAGLLAIFVSRARRHPSPVLELDLFRAPAFTLASVATLFFFAGFAAL